MAKTSTRVLALMCAIFILLSAQPVALAEEAPNLLKNGGFEDLDLWSNGPWTLVPEDNEWGTDGAKVSFSNDSTDAITNMRTGARALNYSNGTATNNKNLKVSQTVTLSAGTYTLSAYIMGESNSPTLFIGDNVSGPFTLTGWNTYDLCTHTVEITEEKEYTVGLNLVCQAGGWGYVDDVTLTKVESAPEEPKEIELENGDFEKGDASNWVLEGYNEVKKGTGVNNTTYALDLWLSNDAEAYGSASYSVALTAGEYYFTFDISGENMSSGLKYAVSSAGATLVQGDEEIATTVWDVWETHMTTRFTLEDAAKVTFTISGTEPKAYWGNLDNLKLYGTGSIVSMAPEKVTADIYVPYVEGTDGEFIRGGDVSSLLSVLKSGGRFNDRDGNSLGDTVEEQGPAFMELLRDAGYNWVRLRVWNDPYDSAHNGYGGGNNDIDAAVTMGKWATDAGLRVLIDFHYSDFWADPGKQQPPKEWQDMDVSAKATAITQFTTESLQALKDAQVDVGMVQVGNETNGFFCGEKSWDNIAQLFKAGSQAVKSVYPDALVALHFTNPEAAGRQEGYAKELAARDVPYDVFASSYYPYWHGTPENLTSVLSNIAKTYGKKVMVAETSWAWTLEEGDGHANTVAKGSNDTPTYPFSVQGQAIEVATVAQAVRNMGDAGLGMFYWESAWIPVSNVNGLTGDAYNEAVAANRKQWEKFGSGWASSYAKDYDPDDAGVWYGGSAIDNQAFFDFDGTPLKSLDVYKYMQTGTEGYVQEIFSVQSPSGEIEVGGTYTLPEKVTVTYTDNTTEDLTVDWDQADIDKVDVSTAGTYTVKGTVTSGELTATVTYTLTVKQPNLLENPGFEEGNTAYTLSHWEGKGPTSGEPNNNRSGSYCLHFYSDAAMSGMTAEQTVTLDPGVYAFSLYAQGGEVGDDADIYSYVKLDDSVITEPIVMAGWHNWLNPVIEFTVAEATDVTVGVSVTAAAKGWGSFDDWYLCKTGEYEPPCAHPNAEHVAAKDATMRAEGNIEYWHCGDCGKYFKAEPLTEDNEITQDATVVQKLTADQCQHPADVLEHVEAKDATYEAEGNIEYWHCGDCGKYFKAEPLTGDNEITKDDTIVPKLIPSTAPFVPSTGTTDTGSVTTAGSETTAAPTVSAGAATVTDTMGSELVDKTEAAGSDVAVVAPKFDEDASSAQVTVPSATVSGLGERTDADLKIETPVADVTIPNEALTELGRGGNVTVSARRSGDAVTVGVSVAGSDVDSVPGGIRAALELGDGDVAVLVNDDGTETILPKSIVDGGTTYVVLEGSATVKVKSGSVSFDDVDSSDWFSSAVRFASSHELFQGTGDGVFSPETAMSRAMVATVLWRLESEAQSGAGVSFPDVDSAGWYAKGVAWASENEIVNGYDNGSFGTGDPVTRQELALMLYRYAKTIGVDTTARSSLAAFADGSKTAGWASDAMSWAVSAGIFHGDGVNLDPTGTASRAQVAEVIRNMVLAIV